MKKLFVTVGLAAVGMSSLQAQYAPGVTSEEMSKPWSVGATLRGFYDDNYLTLPKSSAVTSYGLEFSPAFSLNHSVDQTSYNLGFVYDLRYYDTDKTGYPSSTQTSYQFNGSLHHAFTERYSITVSDAVIASQDPGVEASFNNAAGQQISQPLYAPGNNVHNSGIISGTMEASQLLDFKLTYENDLYDYGETIGDTKNPTPIGAGAYPSYDALLSRMEQSVSLDADWKVQPDLTGILGYKFENTSYSSSEAIIYNGPIGSSLNVYSKERNADSDFVYVGADKDFTSELHGSIRVGGQYVDYYNAPDKLQKVSPYVDANVTWQYGPGSSAQLGARNEHNATDVVGSVGSGSDPVLDEESTSGYASVTQKFGDMTASFLGQVQYSKFNGGSFNDQNEDFVIIGLNLAYRITPYLNGEAGYNWNKLISDDSVRDYTRNVIYVGVRATY